MAGLKKYLIESTAAHIKPHLYRRCIKAAVQGDVYKRQVLEHAGVYKRTEAGKAAFLRFIESVK